MIRVVLCDDDQVLRGVVAKLLTDDGYEIVGETDRPEIAVQLVEANQAGILVLDLSVIGAPGETAISQMRARRLTTKTVVFSAFADDPMRLLDMGATAVIPKPEFNALVEAIHHVADQEGTGKAIPNRRRPTEQRDLPAPPNWRSPSGIERREDFDSVLGAVEPGDAVVVIRLDDVGGSPDDAWVIDQQFEVARIARRTIRPADRLTVNADREVILLLLAGHPEAAQAVWSRIIDVWRLAGHSGQLIGSYRLIREAESPHETHARTVGGARANDEGLWPA